jgi:amino acid transporter
MKNKKVLGVFALAMINVAAVLTLRNFPAMAEYGWASITWYVLGTVLFLLPIALVGAELATAWPKAGGVYAWVHEAFGSAGASLPSGASGPRTSCGSPPCSRSSR